MLNLMKIFAAIYALIVFRKTWKWGDYNSCGKNEFFFSLSRLINAV